MMPLVDFVILALATYRLSLLLAAEDGPLYVLARLRYMVGVRADEYGNLYGDNNFAEGLICQWCNSVWLGLVIGGGYVFIGPLMIWLMLPFSLSAFVVLFSNKE